MTYNLNNYLTTRESNNLWTDSLYKKLDGDSWKKYSNLEQKLYSLNSSFKGAYKKEI